MTVHSVTPPDCDVVVVGGGPAGSTAAALFAGAGFEVRLLERAVFPRLKPCGDFLSPEASRILERLGVDDAVRAAGARRLRGLLISAHGDPPLRADFDPGPRSWGYALERSRLDALLLEAARHAGATILEGWAVEGLGGPGEVRVRPPEGAGTGLDDRGDGDRGRVRRIRARLLVGAGGRRCPVARQLGVQRLASGEGRLDLLCHWDAPNGGTRYCEMHVSGPGYTGIAACAPGVLNVNTVVPRSWMRARARARARSAATRERLAGRSDFRSALYEELVLRVPAVHQAIRSARPLYPPVASDVSPLSTVRASADGVLLAGDAALFIDPFTGQGLYLALRSAELAFEVGAAALSAGDTSSRRLAAYDRLRASEFAPKVRLSRLLQAILYRPRVARRVASALRRDRRGARRLIGVIGDYRPARDLLHPGFLARLAVAGVG